MTIKCTGPFKKYVNCIMAFFTPFNFSMLCQFYSVTSPVLFTKLHQETIEWGKGRFFACMAASAYYLMSTDVKNHIFKHNWIVRHLCIYKQLTLSSGIRIFLCKYYIVISVTLAFAWKCSFFSLTGILSELHVKPRRKYWVTEKST